MSNKIAVGSKIYDISNFSDQEKSDILNLSKSLNYRVNQVISAFKIYDQEMALLISALSLLEENNSLKNALEGQENLFPENQTINGDTYTKEELDELILNIVNSLKSKLQQSIDEK